MALIEKCDICQQRSELQNSFGRMICGDCIVCMQEGKTARRAAEFGFKEERFGAGASGGVKKVYQPGPGDLVKGMNGAGPVAEAGEQVRYKMVERTEEDDEREKYIGVIDACKDEKWIKVFVKEVLKKEILEIDWNIILGNKRWFTTHELKRFAKKLNPDFDKPLPVEDEEEDDLPALVIGEEENPGEDDKPKEDEQETVDAQASD